MAQIVDHNENCFPNDEEIRITHALADKQLASTAVQRENYMRLHEQFQGLKMD